MPPETACPPSRLHRSWRLFTPHALAQSILKSRITATLTAGTLNCASNSGTPSESGATATGCARTMTANATSENDKPQQAHRSSLRAPSYARSVAQSAPYANHSDRPRPACSVQPSPRKRQSTPQAGAFDPARAPIIDRALQRYVDTDRVAGNRRPRDAGRQGRLREGVRLGRQEADRQDDDRYDLPHRVADQGADQRRDSCSSSRKGR